MRSLERKGSDQLVRCKSRRLCRRKSEARTWSRLGPRPAFSRGQHSLPKEMIRPIALMCLVPGHAATKVSEFDVAVYDAMEVWWHYRWFLLLVSYFAAFGLVILFEVREVGTVQWNVLTTLFLYSLVCSQNTSTVGFCFSSST